MTVSVYRAMQSAVHRPRLESNFMSSAIQAALQDALLPFAAAITVVGYVPHVRVDILLEDAVVKEGN